MHHSLFSRIEQRTVQCEVVTLLRDAIINGALDLGEDINEAAIANQMDISRAPLREALRQLEQEGLIRRIPNRGCFVTSYTEQDVIEVFSLRAALECMGMEWADERLTPGDISYLRQQIEGVRQKIAAGDLDNLTELDMQFHEYILIRAGHSRLLRAWYAQSAQGRMLLSRRFRTLADYTPETVVLDHTHILDALERHDTAAAITLTEEICDRVQRECIQVLQHRADKVLVAAGGSR